jgi:large subunit ribosomal protein L4
MELAVYNTKGESTSKKVKLNEEIFGIEITNHSLYFYANKKQ